jgi:hypothetical protein
VGCEARGVGAADGLRHHQTSGRLIESATLRKLELPGRGQLELWKLKRRHREACVRRNEYFGVRRGSARARTGVDG